MYRVGKKNLELPGDFDGDGVAIVRRPFDEIPKLVAEQIPHESLRRMMERGDLTCDFKNGEKPPHTMDHFGGGVVDTARAKDLLVQRGLDAIQALDLDDKESAEIICAVSDVVIFGKKLDEVCEARGVSIATVQALLPKKKSAQQPAA